MENKNDMETLVSVLKKIEDAGFTAQFRVTDKKLESLSSGESFTHEEVTIQHFYRFEGASSQDDEAILYAIATSSGEKGTLVDGYGASNDADVTSFIRKVQDIHK